MQQPMAVVSAIHRDFIKLFAFTRNTAPGDMPISRWQFQTTYPTYPPLITLGYVASIRPGGGALPAAAADDIQPALPSNCPAHASPRRTGAVAGLRERRIPPHRKICTALKGAAT